MTRTTSLIRRRRSIHAKALAALALVAASVALVTSPTSATDHVAGTPARTSAVIAPRSSDGTAYPIGTPDDAEPSGYAPPGASALPGYRLSYVTDFSGTTLPPGWDIFTGVASGDPGSQWGASHVVVGDGMLSLDSWQDPAYNNEWVSGGLCQCGLPHTYGAYFVRSRVTGAGPTEVELLWPVKGWPPEIDVNETSGVTTGTSATMHWSAANKQKQYQLTIDMTQWHTWGVIWTPSAVTFTVDGAVWGQFTVAADIPDQPMTLNLQQQTWCSSGFACPSSTQSTQVDWVAEYSAIPGDPVTIGPFLQGRATLTPALRTQVSVLAAKIATDGDNAVTLTGYSASGNSSPALIALSRARATSVKRYLESRLALLHLSDVSVGIIAAGGDNPVASNATAAGRSQNRRVVAEIS